MISSVFWSSHWIRRVYLTFGSRMSAQWQIRHTLFSSNSNSTACVSKHTFRISDVICWATPIFKSEKTVQKLESSIISHCGRTVFGWKDNKYVRLNQLKAWNWFSLPGSTQLGQEGNGAGGFTTFEFIPPDMKRAVCADLSWHLVGQSTNYQVY